MFQFPATDAFSATTSVAALVLAGFVSSRLAITRRPRRVPKDEERVLIVGGSSGIGRAIAHQYSQRGAKLCIVGRRQDALDEVKTECLSLRSPADKNAVFAVNADFANVEDMIRVRDTLREAWNGVDTVVICAGVSALRPLLEVAGVTDKAEQVTAEGVQHAVEVSNAALRGNYTGPLVSAVTFIPLLESSSSSPAIQLVSSLAALVPAPTRSLYASTKAASLVLYQSLAIEHPRISFSAVVPSTVEGDFRASAVDAGPVREDKPNRHGLKREYVAKRCIQAVDFGERTVFLPYWFSRLGHLVYWTAPAIAEWVARKKYNYSA